MKKIDEGEVLQTLAERLREEGEIKGKLYVASNMILKGCSIDLIKKCTGLSDEQLQPLLH